MIFDDKFETVNSLPTAQPLDKQWAYIFQFGRKCFLDIDYDTDDRPILPSLSQLIKDYNDAKEAKKRNAPTNLIDFGSPNPPPTNPPLLRLDLPSTSSPTTKPTQPSNPPTQRIILPENPVPGGENNDAIIFQEGTASGGVNAPNEETNPQNTSNGRPKRHNVGTYKDGAAIIQQLPIDGESYEFLFSNTLVSEWEHPVLAVANRGQTSGCHPTQKVQQGFLAECYLLQDSWFEDPTCLATVESTFILDSWDTDKYYFNDVSDPRVLETRIRKSKYNDDNSWFDTATRGPF